MISYCIACYRPAYATLLITELRNKTSVPYEIVIWVNISDSDFDAFLREERLRGTPLRIAGRTPENIGMAAYPALFAASRYPMIVQIDDDVVFLSGGIAETAGKIFAQFPQVAMITSDVYQDDYTTGARPQMEHYRCLDSAFGLYTGPVDGWFAIYRRSAIEFVHYLAVERYHFLGNQISNTLRDGGWVAVLCTHMKVFHVVGPEYASYFGQLESEIHKYESIGRKDLAGCYREATTRLPSYEHLEARVERIRTLVANFH